MEHVSDFLTYALGTIAFCTAIGLAVTFSNQVLKSSRDTKELVTSQSNVVSTAYDGSNDESIMSKEQVIEYFLSGLEYTTSVDGIVFSTDEFNSANFNYGIISNDNYERTIKRKANGSIDSVEFRSVRPR